MGQLYTSIAFDLRLQLDGGPSWSHRQTSLGKDWPKQWVVPSSKLGIEQVWAASPKSWETLLVRNMWQERQWLPTSKRRLTTPADQTTVRAVPGQTTSFLVSVRVYCHFSHVRLFAIPWTVAHQAPGSMGFSRQESRSGLPCPPPRVFPTQGLNPHLFTSPALAGEFFTSSTTWEALRVSMLP